MKRYLISIGNILIVLFIAGAVFAQAQERSRTMENARQRIRNMSEEEREQFRSRMRQRFGAGGFGISNEEQLKAIESIQQQLLKFKAALENVDTETYSRFRELSEEERTEFRGKMAKLIQARQETIQKIEEQVALLKGPGRPRTTPGVPVNELRAIHELALKEKATQTADRLETLISRYQGDRRLGQRSDRLDRQPPERPQRMERGRGAGGRRAPEFELNTFDGKTISLSDYRGKIVVLEWMNYECPFSRYHYETKNTMVELANKYKDKNVVWLAVNSTNHATPKANRAFVDKHKLPFAVLDDRSGKVGHAYNAQTTPHMFIINQRGRIVYEGAIDDSPMGQKKENVVNYVDNALAELTAGKAVSTPNTKPYGCTVKYAK